MSAVFVMVLLIISWKREVYALWFVGVSYQEISVSCDNELYKVSFPRIYPLRMLICIDFFKVVVREGDMCHSNLLFFERNTEETFLHTCFLQKCNTDNL